MSRTSRAAAVLDAAARWKQSCLIEGGSLFGEEKLWTSEHFGELQTYFVKRTDESKRSFLEKLRDQLAPAPPEAKRLWAEVTWVYYLIVNSVRGVTKLDRIRTVWEWSEVALPEDHWALGADVLDNGIVHPGRGYSGHQWREYRFLVTMMLDWCRQSVGERESLLRDPWLFAEYLDRQGDRRQIRHALLYLLFPDEFEPIMAPQQKHQIVLAFGDAPDELADSGETDLVRLDKALLEVRRRIAEERPDEEVSFYDKGMRSVWQPDAAQESDVDRGGEGDDAWYASRFGTVDVWVIAPGEGARLWAEFLDAGVAAIGWDYLGDLAEYDSREAVHDALIANGAGENPLMQSLAAWEFVHEVAVGDIVLAKRGRSVILGWGKVTGEYVHDPERAEYRNTRSIRWHPCDAPIEFGSKITTKALTRFTPYKPWLRSVFESMDAGPNGGEQEDGAAGQDPYDLAKAMSDLFLEEGQFSRMVDAIALHKNLILQGPPGVGKTFIARRIAWCLMGCKDSRAVEMVQFHQSYAYEDFVQGWRPTESGGFTLRSGVFLEFCKRAQADLDRPHVFIIDEINRGNLSRIFGELLMLLEADKRGREFAIPLTYSPAGERFGIPGNVHVLGLMNTADRSLAIVDYALRRRFAFEWLGPAYGTRQFREHLLEADLETGLVNRIVRNLSELNERIRDDKDLGPGFEIGHSYFVPEESADEQWYLDTVETQVAPLLREYWFDKPEQVHELVEKLRS
ncbi:MAG: AAA domain-containing protein [Boseongicola sp. SB0662_bin_57]|nr:AAA domain-containing protein [Boseongicola sp. SB0662_bin_57]